MANDSTDELMNAAHHLESALRLERRSPIPRQDDLAVISAALADVEAMLDRRTGPPLTGPSERLRRFWPVRSR